MDKNDWALSEPVTDTDSNISFEKIDKITLQAS